MSRPSRQGLVPQNRDRLKQDFARAPSLRDLHPQVAEVRVEFEFEDGSGYTPSPQAFSYFPAARGFFRYACPRHGCDGEFDLSGLVTELVGKQQRARRSRRMELSCQGSSGASEARAAVACVLCAQVNVSTLMHSTDARE